MSTRINNKLRKYLPSNIISTLSYIDYEIFPFIKDRVSDEEMTRILSNLLRTGKTLADLKNDLVDVIDGKENEISQFVNSYPRTNKNNMTESIAMIFLGFFVAFCLFRGIILAI